MRALTQTAYGDPEVFELQEVPEPTPKKGEVLVRVRSTSIHAGDLWMMRGNPWMTRLFIGVPRPRGYVPGYDVAGTVAALGEGVEGLSVGDEVFGAVEGGGLAEQACVPVDTLVPRPPELPAEQAGAAACSGLTALKGIRDVGRVQAGQHVLIHGASGGVGSYAVQIAKALGAEVTGTCSASKLDFVLSLGADHVIDYRAEDFTLGQQRYDLIFDQAASHSLSACRRVLTDEGRHIPNSGKGGLWFVIKAALASLVSRQQERPYLATPTGEDLRSLADWIAAGEVTPAVEHTFPLAEAREAFRYLEGGKACGKVGITVASSR